MLLSLFLLLIVSVFVGTVEDVVAAVVDDVDVGDACNADVESPD